MKITGKFRPSKCKRHLDIVLGKMLQPNVSTELDKFMPYIRAANVQWGQIDWSDLKEMWFSPTDKKKYTLKDGDLVVLEGGDVGRCAILQNTPSELGFQNSIHRVRARKGTELRFAYYWMAHLKSFGYLDLVCSKATLAHFTGEKFAEAPFPVVDLATQRQIADFLDRETARIDLLIEKKQRLVALLGEKAKSVNELFFINADATSTQPLHRLYRVVTGKTPSRNEEDNFSVEDGLPWATPANLGFLAPVVTTKEYLTEQGSAGQPVVDAGTVLLNGIGASVGKIGIAGTKLSFNQQIHALIPKKKVLADRFLFFQLLTLKEQLVLLANSTTLPILNAERLGRLELKIFDLEEQRRHCVNMDALLRHEETTAQRINTSIDRLKEYRSALITAAVTGQIDVSTYAKSGTLDRRLDTIQEELTA